MLLNYSIDRIFFDSISFCSLYLINKGMNFLDSLLLVLTELIYRVVLLFVKDKISLNLSVNCTCLFFILFYFKLEIK